LKGTTFSSSTYRNKDDISFKVIIYVKNPSTIDSTIVSITQEQYLTNSVLNATWQEYMYYASGFIGALILGFCCCVCLVCCCLIFCGGAGVQKSVGYGRDYYVDDPYVVGGPTLIVGGPTVVVGDFGDRGDYYVDNNNYNGGYSGGFDGGNQYSGDTGDYGGDSGNFDGGNEY
jgi:hypothetical protein